jgi:hypothetical protein
MRVRGVLRVVYSGDLKCVKVAPNSTIVLFVIPETKKQAFRTYLIFLVVCMRHSCCCSTSNGAQQSAIPADVVLTIRSACQTYTLSQSTSRTKTVTHACVMKHISGTVLKSSSLFCASYAVQPLKYLTLIPTWFMKLARLRFSVTLQQNCQTFAYVQLLSVA